MLSGYNDKELYKICLDEEDEEEVDCNSPPISNLSEVIQVMKSSWISRSHCVNVEVEDNVFVILPSITDDYFTMKTDDVQQENVSQLMLAGPDWSELINCRQLGRNTSRLGRRNNKGKTFLFSLSTAQVSASLRSDIERAPQLYLSTFLSAALKDNVRCVEYLQAGGLTFRQDRCLTAVGLTDDPWSSPCITDLSHVVVKQIFDSKGSALVH